VGWECVTEEVEMRVGCAEVRRATVLLWSQVYALHVSVMPPLARVGPLRSAV